MNSVSTGSSPQVPKFVMGTGGASLPDGSYYATLVGISPVPEKVVNNETWKAGWEFVFEVASGPHKGSRKSTINRNPVPTDRNGLGRTLAGLLGRLPQPGEPIDPSGCIGTKYLIVVQAGKITSIGIPPQQ